jgi:membrane-associated protease RseP (regulator of RpoE activity)
MRTVFRGKYYPENFAGWFLRRLKIYLIIAGLVAQTFIGLAGSDKGGFLILFAVLAQLSLLLPLRKPTKWMSRAGPWAVVAASFVIIVSVFNYRSQVPVFTTAPSPPPDVSLPVQPVRPTEAPQPTPSANPAPPIGRKLSPTSKPSIPRPSEKQAEETMHRLRNGITAGTAIQPAPDSLNLPPAYSTTSISQIGLICRTLTPSRAAELGLDNVGGLEVIGLTTGSPAAASGIRAGDVILKIAGSEIHDLSLLKTIAVESTVTGSVPVQILRSGHKLTVQLNLDTLRP